MSRSTSEDGDVRQPLREAADETIGDRICFIKVIMRQFEWSGWLSAQYMLLVRLPDPSAIMPHMISSERPSGSKPGSIVPPASNFGDRTSTGQSRSNGFTTRVVMNNPVPSRNWLDLGSASVIQHPPPNLQADSGASALFFLRRSPLNPAPPRLY
jgi:hypothetical protein